MKALKMFAYIFPELNDLPSFLVNVSSGKISALPHEEDLRTWLSKRYSNMQTIMLHGTEREELERFIASHPDSIVVMGAYGRSGISRFFHKSLANTVIQHTKSHLLITHE